QTSATITGTLIDFGADSVLRTLIFTLGSPTNATLGASATNTLTMAETPAVTWTVPADIPYGTPLGALQLNATASIPGFFAYGPAAGTILGAGNNQSLSVTFTPQVAADSPIDYTTATVMTTLNITRATPVLAVADAGGVYNGEPFPATATVAGVV